MTTATAPRPTTTILVPSDSTPGVEYRTSATRCSCPSFQFAHDATFRCKHMIRRFPAMRMCSVCRVNPVIDLPTCVMCGDADPVHARQVAITAAPTCAGYLREHAAPADEAIRFWCDSCVPEDCR